MDFLEKQMQEMQKHDFLEKFLGELASSSHLRYDFKKSHHSCKTLSGVSEIILNESLKTSGELGDSSQPVDDAGELSS